jgi:dihydroorotase
MTLLLKNGRLVDPSQDIDGPMDILIRNGKVARIARNIPSPAGKGKKTDNGTSILDMKGLVVVPGLIDMHVHLREPGFEYKETIRTGCEAAAAGGFTAVACMANTDPVNDNRSVTEFILREAAASGKARVYPVASITRNLEGKILSEFWDLKEAGAAAFSDDGRPVTNGSVMRRALEYAHSLDMPVLSHSEDPTLSAGGLMNESIVSTELGLRGIPAAAEEAMIARDILLAEYTRTSIHICHVTTAGSVRLLREARARGVAVTAETAPHYFTLSDEALRDYDTNLKVNPPLRSAADMEAIREALRDGTIDAVASDHAPHALTDKAVEFDVAAFGMVGLETSLGLTLKLVHKGVLTLPEMVLRMSLRPAQILRVPGGTLKPGSDADITVLDLNRFWTVDSGSFRSRSRNTPFQDMPMKGKAVMTIVGGRVVYRESENAS